MTRLLLRLGLALLVGVLVTAVLAWYLSGRITRPLRRLAGAADEVAEGRYDTEVPLLTSGDEVADLADSFRQMTSRLSEAEELERNFLMTVSHELRTPLTAIRGHVEALREGVVDDPALRTASLDVISAEAMRLERLVGDVLDLAKLDTRRFTVRHEEVDMARLLEQAYLSFGEEAKQRKIDYSQEVSAEPVIVTDGDRVLQIITNLLANAFRWTPNGGSVGLHLSSENGNIHVAVEDTGPGIGPEEQDRIFRPFWTHDGKGTGLGLAIARELAMALGGRIDLDSEVGRGSTFELVLPTQPVSAGLAGFALFEAVDLGAAAGVELALHAREADVDAAPAGRDQVDEQREVVDPRVPLRKEIGFEPLEAANRLPGEPAHLGELLGDRSGLGADALTNRFLDPPGKRRLELGGDLRQLLDLPSRTLEGRFDVAEGRTASGCAFQPLSRPCDRRFFHGRDASVRVG